MLDVWCSDSGDASSDQCVSAKQWEPQCLVVQKAFREPASHVSSPTQVRAYPTVKTGPNSNGRSAGHCEKVSPWRCTDAAVRRNIYLTFQLSRLWTEGDVRQHFQSIWRIDVRICCKTLGNQDFRLPCHHEKISTRSYLQEVIVTVYVTVAGPGSGCLPEILVGRGETSRADFLSPGRHSDGFETPLPPLELLRG